MTALEPSPTARVLLEVLDERTAQHAKWGEQNHPDGTGPDVVWTDGGVRASWVAEDAKEATDAAAATGTLTYLLIMKEEVAEAFAEDNPAMLRAELVQAAAVAVAWIEAIDRRRGATS